MVSAMGEVFFDNLSLYQFGDFPVFHVEQIGVRPAGQPIFLDAESTRGCQAHAGYLARNAPRLKDTETDRKDEDANGRDDCGAREVYSRSSWHGLGWNAVVTAYSARWPRCLSAGSVPA